MSVRNVQILYTKDIFHKHFVVLIKFFFHFERYDLYFGLCVKTNALSNDLPVYDAFDGISSFKPVYIPTL